MPVRAKICGLTTPATITAAVGGGAAHVGLVFFPPSPRHLSHDRAAQLAALVPDHVGRVGVFVDPDDDTVRGAVLAGNLTALQLHKTAPGRAAALKAMTGLEIWSAIAVRTRDDLMIVRDHVGAADLILYDAKTPEGSALPGGMGVRFDWGLLDGFRHPLPWALSGGLTPDTVGEAVRQTRAELVDVSSGVESAPGIKDMDKIAAFLNACSSL